MSNEIKKDLHFPNLHTHLLLGVRRSSVFRTPQKKREKAYSNNNTKWSDCLPTPSTYATCPMLSNCPAASHFNSCKNSSEMGNTLPVQRDLKSIEWLRMWSTIIRAEHSLGFKLIRSCVIIIRSAS